MIGFALVAAGAAGAHSLSWEGTAEVYPPGQVLKIAVRSSIDRDGTAVSESWPVDIGEAKGLRRMKLSSTGGTIERGGQIQAMPKEMWNEEHAQFGFYQQLQAAVEQVSRHVAEGVNLFSVPGAVTTWFRIGPDGKLIGAVNEVPAGNGTAWQEFRFDGLLKSNGAVFPRQMRMTRNGERYFMLEVTKFDAR